MSEPASREIRNKFDNWAPKTRDAGLQVRELILETARNLPEVGEVFETLKWNQPAYLTPQTRSGSTIRIDAIKNSNLLGIYVHCQTSLISDFKVHYSDVLRFDKNRAILLDATRSLPIEALRHCIGLALTYHSGKQTK